MQKNTKPGLIAAITNQSSCRKETACVRKSTRKLESGSGSKNIYIVSHNVDENVGSKTGKILNKMTSHMSVRKSDKLAITRLIHILTGAKKYLPALDHDSVEP